MGKKKGNKGKGESGAGGDAAGASQPKTQPPQPSASGTTGKHEEKPAGAGGDGKRQATTSAAQSQSQPPVAVPQQTQPPQAQGRGQPVGRGHQGQGRGQSPSGRGQPTGRGHQGPKPGMGPQQPQAGPGPHQQPQRGSGPHQQPQRGPPPQQGPSHQGPPQHGPPSEMRQQKGWGPQQPQAIPAQQQRLQGPPQQRPQQGSQVPQQGLPQQRPQQGPPQQGPPQQGLPQQRPQQGLPQQRPQQGPPQQVPPQQGPPQQGLPQQRPQQGPQGPPQQGAPMQQPQAQQPGRPGSLVQGPPGQQRQGPTPGQQRPGPQKQQTPPTQQMGDMALSLPKSGPVAKITPGVKGRKIIVDVNHFKLDLGKLNEAIHYDVAITPDTPKKFMRNVMEAFRQKYYPSRFPAFDGRKNLYTSSFLPFEGSLGGEVTIADGDRPKEYKVVVKFAARIDLRPLRDIGMSVITPQAALQCVDVVLRSAPAKLMVPIGRSFFTKPKDQIIDLGEGMEMYYGFFQSAIRGWKPLLNVDVAHKAFPKATGAIDAILDVLSNRGVPMNREELTRPLQAYNVEKVEKFFKGLRVVYEIPRQPASRRAYRINGLKRCARDEKFKQENGAVVSVEQYFQQTKGIKLQFPLVPTFWVGSMQRENPILIPAEFCTLEANQGINRKMTDNQTAAMIRKSATNTQIRRDKIEKCMREAQHNTDPAVREFGFSVGSQFERVGARVLEPPRLQYGGNREAKVAKGVWRSEGCKYITGAQVNKWTIVTADRYDDARGLRQLADNIYSYGQNNGIQFAAKATEPFAKIGGRQQLHDIKQYFEKNKGYDLIFVVVPNAGQTYGLVKKVAEIQVGCLTQCIKSRTLTKANDPSTITNILLKINSKLNGINHILLTRPPILSRPCMFMGADVTHPRPEAKFTPSVAAVTASHEPKAFAYNISCTLQGPAKEIIEDLQRITRDHLMFFYKKNNVKPERIIFVRDGVSEGQFEDVKQKELLAIRAACKSLEAGYEPKITFLVVQKRHHTRLFPTNPRDSEDRNCNVPAGTCVDTDITNPFMQDFYLVSHASIQGVAKPTKYCTLWDDNNFSNDEIEELMYYLCHMFTRCNRSVSYPAPTYYAHLAAARAKVYIESENINLDRLQQEQNKINILDIIRKDKPMFFV